MNPVRTCVGCRQRSLQNEMFRVVNQNGKLVADLEQKLSGRGAWLHKDRKCFDQALLRRAFGRSLRLSIGLDTSELEEQAEMMLAK